MATERSPGAAAIQKTLRKLLEVASINSIAYDSHDADDALELRLLKLDDLFDVV